MKTTPVAGQEPVVAERDSTPSSVTLLSVHREFLSAAENRVFVLMGALVFGLWLHSGSPHWTHLAWFVAGWLLFVPQEYFAHVYVLHLSVPRTEWAYRWMYRLHYGHHDHPKRHDLMYMPLWISVPMTLANWLFFSWVTPDLASSCAAFGGALVAYMLFEWTHLLAHVPYVPKSEFWRRVRSQHLMHHHLNEKVWFAVAPTSLFIDQLMGTKQTRGDMARSPDCRFLGLDPASPWIARARERFCARSSGSLEASRLWHTKAALHKRNPSSKS